VTTLPSVPPKGAPKPKPLLRGVVHEVSFYLGIPLVIWLVHSAPTSVAAVCAAIYGASLLALLGCSALYHRKHWAPAPRARMKSLDHSMIFVLIAGTYTPVCWLGVGGTRGQALCLAIWAGAVLGVAQTLLWKTAPRWLHVGIYVVVGWTGALGLAAETARLGTSALALHVGGGVIYTLGALVYARKRPDPIPHVFGYHEVFHVLVVIACGCLFEVVRRSLVLTG
jgi:hemolysin III